MMLAFTDKPGEWNEIISQLPMSHFLQTWEWAEVKAKYDWIPMPYIWRDERSNIIAASMILKKQITSRGFPARFSIFYSPKGPLLDWSNTALRSRVLNDLESFAKKQSAIFLKIDPDIVLGRGIPGSEEDIIDANGQTARSELMRRGWVYSSDQIQFQNTVLINVNSSEEELLAYMKPKTRYNIRLAEKKGVSIRIGILGDLPGLYKMYAETSVRDGFVIRDENYYITVWKLFMQNFDRLSVNVPACIPLVAEVDNELVAAIFLFMFASRAYYVYGMSRNLHRDKMPTHLLQWEAMKRAKENGCTIYDLWGAPEIFDESDSMWGVYRFKEGLGGEVIRTLGAYDFAPTKVWYKLYTEVMPHVLNVMRSRGKEKTRQMLSA
jgi:peptidoglycan pentaglycine glycine transferase (the first glycine)